MKIKNWFLLVASFSILLILNSCAPGGGSSSIGDPAGFFMGIWHGWIAPISLIWGLFNPEIRVYEMANSGWWYDFGFYIAIIGGFGSISFIRKSKKKKDI